ncbi:MAG: histidine kinase dimerization/phospho-acceptor domain-containing protein, partial [Phenylobacterium sp.]|nr:histidine kinase dimerization/phospho-acceptor domain-containing protein [Phenylobacterium sp.]
MTSLSRRFLVSVAVMSLVVTILGSLGAFLLFQRELSNRQISFLQDYVRERSSNVERRFSNLTALHEAAGEELERRVNNLTDAEANRLADAYFPLRPDGTRRSRDIYFDGTMTDGSYMYGMGAMIADADALTMDEKKVLVASFRLVSSFGQAARKDYDNFYFFTPPHTRLTMFGPERPDRLMFYRREAPADLDISKEEMSRLTQPAANPLGITRCTSLQRLVQDNVGARLATACLTPAVVNGRAVGAFGSSIELSGFLDNAVKSSLPGATSMVVTSKGELIAYPGFSGPIGGGEDRVAQIEATLRLKPLVAAIARTGRASGVIESPDGQQIVAFGQLRGPDWYLMLAYPKSAVTASAARSASWLLLVGALATAIQTILVVLLARRAIVWPIQRLARSCEDDEGARPDVSSEEARADEIGVLARALKAEREKAEAAVASLEDRVRERTAQLERANTEKSRFLANMSHELRTPLNGVIAISETLAREQVTPKGRDLAELIVASGRLLERVLTDILDFS